MQHLKHTFKVNDINLHWNCETVADFGRQNKCRCVQGSCRSTSRYAVRICSVVSPINYENVFFRIPCQKAKNGNLMLGHRCSIFDDRVDVCSYVFHQSAFHEPLLLDLQKIYRCYMFTALLNSKYKCFAKTTSAMVCTSYYFG